MFEAKQAIFKAKRAIFKAGRATFEAKQAIFEAKRAIFKAKCEIFHAKRVIVKAERTMFEAKRAILNAKRVIFKAERAIFEAMRGNEAKRGNNVHGIAGAAGAAVENQLRIRVAILSTLPTHRPRAYIHTGLLQSISRLGRIRLEPPNSDIYISILRGFTKI